MVLVSMPFKGEILDVIKKRLSSLDARPCIRFGSQNRASAGEMRIDLVAHILGSLSTSNEVFSINFQLLVEAKGAMVAFLPKQQLPEYAFFLPQSKF